MTNWLAMHARFRPDAEALYDVDADERFTYAQLLRRSRQHAARLQAEGVGKGDVVAVLAHNRGDTFAVLFACAQLGATLFPMNWRLAPAELRWQLQDSRAKVVLTDVDHAGILAGLPLTEPGQTELDGPTLLEEDDAWMLMYTSGTSGRPKGALLTARQVLYNAINTVLACDLTPQDSTLTFTPIFHTGGMNCLSTPLFWRGGRIVLTRGFDPAQALHLVANEGVTLLMGVPTIYQMIADHPGFSDTDFSGVRDALCGGAPLSLPLLERYLDRGIPLRQGFGMTEVGPNCFSMPPHMVREKLGTVGLPIHHLETRLVRADGTDCGVDEPGELWLRGPVRFAGYLGKDSTFVDDGWFRTGDVLSRDADGYFSVRGRLKSMFISGGENVYPAEVESAILEHPAVGQVAVLGVPDERWGEVGRAFVEPAPGTAFDADALKPFLADRLARYKIPKHVVVMEALPRTASGKIDKPALKGFGA